ncbi:hypothetical protein [Streptomyces sp. NPDC047928]|uniref:hypothetical protein n=1 Tax=unclassified Streptomyces TaxID=2593676 RepID=UPI00371CAEAB
MNETAAHRRTLTETSAAQLVIEDLDGPADQSTALFCICIRSAPADTAAHAPAPVAAGRLGA